MARTCELYLRLCGDELPSSEGLEAIIRAALPSAILIARTILEKPGNKHPLNGAMGLIRGQDIAVLFEDDTSLAAKLKADGVHLNGTEADVREARRLLDEDAYVGVSSPLSRHEAMVLGEAGASYVAFAANDDFDALLDMTEWWADIIDLPCAIWLDADADEAMMRELIEAGADYLAPEVVADTEPDRLARIHELVKSSK
jgi:thiamine-phosphate pyrophosphorylase